VDEKQHASEDYVDGITRTGQIALKEFTKHTFAVLIDFMPPDNMK
jgi:hypothetical protein